MTNVLSLKNVGSKVAKRRFPTGPVKHIKKIKRSMQLVSSKLT